MSASWLVQVLRATYATIQSKEKCREIEKATCESEEVLPKERQIKEPQACVSSSKLLLDSQTLVKLKSVINKMPREELLQAGQAFGLQLKGSTKQLRIQLKKFATSRFGHRPSSTQTETKPKRRVEARYICVVDFEATCEENDANFPNEIIEFPVVIVDVQKKEIIEKVQFYCRPKLNPVLSSFCIELTGITQDMVDQADEFPDVLNQIMAVLNRYISITHKHGVIVASDGPWDFRDFFHWQCMASGLAPPPIMSRWLDIRKAFRSMVPGTCRGEDQLQSMLSHFDLAFEGTPHSGLDDAYNAARVLIKLLEQGLHPACNTTKEQTRTTKRASRKLPHLQRGYKYQSD
eukprot:gene2623-5525_t